MKPKHPYQRGYNFDVHSTYMFMRFTMMHYGPHFREAYSMWRRGPRPTEKAGNRDETNYGSSSYGVCRYSSMCEEWEKHTEIAHPSILDCALQCQSGLSSPATRQDHEPHMTRDPDPL